MAGQTVPDWFVCVHEAGHCVASAVRGGRITSVSVTPQGDSLGEVNAEFRPDDWRSLAVYAMSGYWAQHLLTDQKDPWPYCMVDQQIWETAFADHDVSLEAGERCFQAAEDLVRDHERDIIAVAHLLQAGSGADEVTRYLDTQERRR